MSESLVENENRVRGDLIQSGWILHPLSKSSCRVTFINQIDLQLKQSVMESMESLQINRIILRLYNFIEETNYPPLSNLPTIIDVNCFDLYENHD